MKAILPIITAILLSLILFSCTPQNKEQNASSMEGTPSQNSVQLNNGNRWKANVETTTSIAKMIQQIDAYENEEEKPPLSTLADTLDAEFKLIFKNCTMKGEGHDQLHNYLLPVLRTIRTLSNQNEEVNEKSIQKLKKQLHEYDQYFYSSF